MCRFLAPRVIVYIEELNEGLEDRYAGARLIILLWTWHNVLLWQSTFYVGMAPKKWSPINSIQWAEISGNIIQISLNTHIPFDIECLILTLSCRCPENICNVENQWVKKTGWMFIVLLLFFFVKIHFYIFWAIKVVPYSTNTYTAV